MRFPTFLALRKITFEIFALGLKRDNGTKLSCIPSIMHEIEKTGRSRYNGSWTPPNFIIASFSQNFEALTFSAIPFLILEF